MLLHISIVGCNEQPLGSQLLDSSSVELTGSKKRWERTYKTSLNIYCWRMTRVKTPAETPTPTRFLCKPLIIGVFVLFPASSPHQLSRKRNSFHICSLNVSSVH